MRALVALGRRPRVRPGTSPLDRAFAVIGLPGSVKLVLLAMAKVGNATDQCFASQEYLATLCGCSVRTVRRAQSFLLTAGFIMRLPRGNRATDRFLLQHHRWVKHAAKSAGRGGP